MTRKATLLLASLLSLFLLVSPAFGAQDLFISEAGGEIAFTPNKAYGVATLTVSGPDGFHYERTFEGQTASINLFGLDQYPADGSYRWTLTATSQLGDALRADMEKARELGDEGFMKRVREAGYFQSQKFQGHFLVASGALIIPELSTEVEEVVADEVNAPTKAQVFTQDVIAEGSLCVGVDCESNESFGFDTIRIKENNLRIKFEDTSNAGGNFPSNDWEIQANASGNGGADSFSILDKGDDGSSNRAPFVIEAGAPTNAIYVGADGQIGIGENDARVMLHVTDGNSPALRLEQDGSDGFQSQIWDLAGNEANFFVRDVTNASALPFRVLDGAIDNGLVLDSDGVGIGLQNPSAALHVRSSDGDGQLLLQETNSTVTQRVMLKIENEGIPSFQMEDTDSGDKWSFSVKSEGFEFSKGGTGTQEFVLDGNGDLYLSGSVISNGGSYADYVFDEGYDLLSLEEVQSFIEANGHLPNVKSEEEVDYGRKINISELSVKLLEKVEELTLYTIEQHNTIKELKERVAALEGGND